MKTTGAILATAALSLFSGVSAHMRMRSPVPMGWSSLNNSPLEDDGSDFPCKQRAGVYNIETMNDISVGVPQTLSFIGDAVHGGGSCQVSVTLDKQPTKNSQWKVVKSIIGGCPANAAGNLGDDANGLRASTFKFSLPSGMPNGEYTLAWTWVNKIGNRELYMNCAAIRVTGGSDGDLSVYNSLPDMFVVNIPRAQCSVDPFQEFAYPNPGAPSAVETAGQGPYATAVKGPGCASMTKMGAGTGAPAAPTAAPPTATVGSTVSVPTTTTVPKNNNPGGIFAPGASPKPATTTAAATTLSTAAASKTAASNNNSNNNNNNSGNNPGNNVAVPQPSPPKNTASPTPEKGDITAGNGQCPAGSVACDKPGTLVCASATQWGTCDINGCAVLRVVAEGTECKKENSVAAIAALAQPHKRSMHRHFRKHMLGSYFARSF